MAISVGDAMLKLGVDTKDLDKGMKGIGAKIKQHQKAIGIGMVAAGGAILAAGALSIKTFAEMGDEVAKLARKTGFSTVALSELRHVADISGTSLEGLEKATKRMATAIGDAQDGLAETIRDFDKLGISVEELKGLSPEEAFLKLGEAIAGVEDPLIRANIAQGIFGRAGMDLIPMFDEGTEAMAALRQEAHDLGIVFDEEAAKKAEEMTDAMHRMKEATSGVKMVIAEQLIPALMPLIEKITETIASISDWAEKHPILTKVIVLSTAAFGFLLIALGGLLLIMPGLTAAMAAFGITLSLAIWPITLIALGIAGLIAIGIVLWRNWDSITRDIARAWTTVGDVFKNVGTIITNTFQNAVNWVLNLWGILKAFWMWLAHLFTVKERGPTPAAPSLWGRGAAVKRVGGFVEEMQAGGIAMRPMLASIAERTPEAVIPLDKLDRMIGGKSVNIFVELDGRTIARAIGQPFVDEIRLRTGVHI